MRDWLCNHYYVPCAVLILLGFAGFLFYLARRVRMKDMIMITVLSAIIAISRGVFFWIPQFKPVSALVLITGSCFGSVPGMLVGMLSGFLSNFMFSQGPWTPFQMLSWGLIGIIGGFCRSMQGKNPADDHRIFGDGICVWPNPQFCVVVIGNEYADVERILDDGSERIFV